MVRVGHRSSCPQVVTWGDDMSGGASLSVQHRLKDVQQVGGKPGDTQLTLDFEEILLIDSD